jgi:hypothetical protein
MGRRFSFGNVQAGEGRFADAMFQPFAVFAKGSQITGQNVFTDAGQGLAPGDAIPGGKAQGGCVVCIQTVDLGLAGAQVIAAQRAGGADIIDGFDNYYDLGLAIGRAQAVCNDGGHIGSEVGGVSFALKANRTKEVVGAEADHSAAFI